MSKRFTPTVQRARARRLPAMTQEHWHTVMSNPERAYMAARGCALQVAESIFNDDVPALLRLAALALHAQPFGVPEHSVDALRQQIAKIELVRPDDPTIAPLEQLLAFIESLLPPEREPRPGVPADLKPHRRLRLTTTQPEEPWQTTT